MVYLLKLVIFHGYVSHNQRVKKHQMKVTSSHQDSSMKNMERMGFDGVDHLATLLPNAAIMGYGPWASKLHEPMSHVARPP